MRLVLLPRENARDVDTSIGGIEVVLVSTVAEALAALAVAPGLRRPARRPRKAVR
jgi:hypothetical protein